MRLDALLAAHGAMRIERPPELWEADTDDTRVVPLLDAMLAAALSQGAARADLTLNAANVVVAPPDDGEEAGPPLPGEYVAVTVSGPIDFGPDAVWPSPPGRSGGLLAQLADRLADARARFAYVRRLSGHGAVTVFLSRAALPGPPA